MADLIYDNGDDTIHLDLQKVKEQIIEKIHNNPDKLVELHNEFCDNNGYEDDKIHHQYELDDIYIIGRKLPSEIMFELRHINRDDLYFNVEYESFNNPVEAEASPVDLSKMLIWLSNEQRLDELADALDIDLESESLLAEVKKSNNLTPK